MRDWFNKTFRNNRDSNNNIEPLSIIEQTQESLTTTTLRPGKDKDAKPSEKSSKKYQDFFKENVREHLIELAPILIKEEGVKYLPQKT